MVFAPLMGMRPPGRVAITLCAFTLVAPTTTAAQQSVRGVVVRAGTDDPIGHANVYLVAANGIIQGSTYSDSAGSFLVWVPTPGVYTLHVHRQGYLGTRSDSLDVPARQSVQVRVNLQPDAVMLEAITVFGEAPPALTPELEGFLARRRMRIGYNFSREDIERLKADHPIDLLREVPGFVTLSHRTSERSYFLNYRRCPPAIYIDGRPTRIPQTELIELQSLYNVYGVEVFRDWSSVPMEYQRNWKSATETYNFLCGVILIWTRPPGP